MSERAFVPDPDLRLMVEEAPDIMVLMQPDGRCRHVSPASLALLGRLPQDLCGSDLRDLVLDVDRHTMGDFLDRLRAGENAASIAIRLRQAGGGWVWMEANAKRIPAGEGVVLALRDITARKQGEAILEEANSLLRRRACEDQATGLANRGHFIASLERELRRARREGATVAVVAVELDEHGLFVDFYGHEAGERAVVRVAECVRATLYRPGDVAGRLSGAALGLMLPATDAAGAAETMRRLSEMVAALEIPHAGLKTGTLRLRAASLCSMPNSLAHHLVASAEQAARKAKPMVHVVPA